MLCLLLLWVYCFIGNLQSICSATHIIWPCLIHFQFLFQKKMSFVSRQLRRSCLFSLVKFFYSDTGIGWTLWNGLDCKAHESKLFAQLWIKVVCTTLIQVQVACTTQSSVFPQLCSTKAGIHLKNLIIKFLDPCWMIPIPYHSPCSEKVFKNYWADNGPRHCYWTVTLRTAWAG